MWDTLEYIHCSIGREEQLHGFMVLEPGANVDQ